MILQAEPISLVFCQTKLSSGRLSPMTPSAFHLYAESGLTKRFGSAFSTKVATRTFGYPKVSFHWFNGMRGSSMKRQNQPLSCLHIAGLLYI